MSLLEPGRFLDALVAEYVMGYKLTESYDEFDVFRVPEDCAASHKFIVCSDKAEVITTEEDWGDVCYEDPHMWFRPSVWWSDAGVVLGQLSGFDLEIFLNSNVEEAPFLASLIDDNDLCFAGGGTTGPHAICIAALAWIKPDFFEEFES